MAGAACQKRACSGARELKQNGCVLPAQLALPERGLFGTDSGAYKTRQRAQRREPGLAWSGVAATKGSPSLDDTRLWRRIRPNRQAAHGAEPAERKRVRMQGRL